MARTSIDYDTRTPTARLKIVKDPKLGPRDTPYTRQIGPGKLLGYICRRAGKAGTWVLLEWGGVRHKRITLGLADDIVRADGRTILTYEQAMKKATDPVAPESPAAASLTVAEAIKTYYDNSPKANRERYRNQLNGYMTKALNETRVDQLDTDDLQAWFTGLTRPQKSPTKGNPDRVTVLAKASANRVLGQLKAPLYAAFLKASNRVPSSAAWDRVKPHKKANKARTNDLNTDQTLRFIAAAATFSGSLANLMEAAFLTGARAPGELRMVDKRDFDAASRSLHIRFGKVADSTGPRYVFLSDEAVAFFTRCAKGKLPDAPLLPGADGLRWPEEGHYRDVCKAARIAKLPSGKGGVGVYTLRHAYISRAIECGIPLKVIADNCGTSVTMIEEHYAKLVEGTRAEMFQRLGPKLRVVA